jgi:hypothetical protein
MLSLVRGIPAIVIFPDSEEDIPKQVEEYATRVDSARWGYAVRTRPFSWAWYREWWIARRWVLPRAWPEEAPW